MDHHDTGASFLPGRAAAEPDWNTPSPWLFGAFACLTGYVVMAPTLTGMSIWTALGHIGAGLGLYYVLLCATPLLGWSFMWQDLHTHERSRRRCEACWARGLSHGAMAAVATLIIGLLIAFVLDPWTAMEYWHQPIMDRVEEIHTGGTTAP